MVARHVARGPAFGVAFASQPLRRRGGASWHGAREVYLIGPEVYRYARVQRSADVLDKPRFDFVPSLLRQAERQQGIHLGVIEIGESFEDVIEIRFLYASTGTAKIRKRKLASVSEST